ncbi:transcriptional regulator, partial [Bacillus sp. D-CC]
PTRRSSRSNNQVFIVKVRYNYAKALCLSNHFEDALYQLNEAIETSCHIGSMELIGHFQNDYSNIKLLHSYIEL